MNIEENIARSLEIRRQTKEAGLAFLKTDVEAALTFAQVALQAGSDSERKSRNQTNARKGYDSIARLIRRIAPLCTEGEKQEFEQKFDKLRDALKRLGETL